MNLRRLLAIAPAWPLAAALIDPAVPFAAKGLIAATAAISAWDPAEGILLVAGLAPLGILLGNQLDIPLRVAETIVLAFLAGWLAHGGFARRGPRLPAAVAAVGVLFGWIVAMSAVTRAVVLAHAHNLQPTLGLVEWAYLSVSDAIGVSDAAKLVEGLALVAAVIDLVRRRPVVAERVPAALAASAVAAAAASVLLWAHLAPKEVLEQYGQIDYRVTANVADVNAAGSFFALVLCLAAGCAARERTRLGGWGTAIVGAIVGLWLTTSRSALWSLIAVAALIVGTLIAKRWPTRTRVAVAIAIAVMLAAGGALQLRRLNASGYGGATMRAQFAATSLRMIAERPAFGVGIGQYFPTSRLFLPPELAWIYGTENAHNYFLQITAETGIVGGLSFIVFLAGLLWHAWRGIDRAPRDFRLLGLFAGSMVFLATCLTGHPLLVPEVAIPFWITLGLGVVLGGSALSRTAVPAFPSRRATMAGAAFVVAAAIALAATVPWRAARPNLTPPRSLAVTGRFPAEFDRDRNVFQWTSRYASIFVPDSFAMVELPVRAPIDVGHPGLPGIEIAAGTGGKDRMLIPEHWVYPLIDLRGAPAVGGLKRIDLRVDRLARVGDREVGVAVRAPQVVTPR